MYLFSVSSAALKLFKLKIEFLHCNFGRETLLACECKRPDQMEFLFSLVTVSFFGIESTWFTFLHTLVTMFRLLALQINQSNKLTYNKNELISIISRKKNHCILHRMIGMCEFYVKNYTWPKNFPNPFLRGFCDGCKFLRWVQETEQKNVWILENRLCWIQSEDWKNLSPIKIILSTRAN